MLSAYNFDPVLITDYVWRYHLSGIWDDVVLFSWLLNGLTGSGCVVLIS